MRAVLLAAGFLISTFLYSQNIPGVAWSKRVGGNWHDVIDKIVPINNAGWLVLGSTASSNGDAGSPQGGVDTWISYWNGAGRLKWKRNLGSFSGDAFVDYIYKDGYIHVLYSVTTPPYHDIFLAKLDMNGNVLYDAQFGGAGDDIPVKLLPCSDGYMILARSTSTELPNHHGGTDVYVIKIKDTLDIIEMEWDTCLGGSSTDQPFGGVTDSNGNIVIVGESSSTNGDVITPRGSADIWVVNLSPLGTINWQKSYGGSGNEFYGSIVKSSDENLVVACRTTSFDGDVTGFHYGGIGVPDAWVFKIDPLGNIIWKNCFGGTGNETVYGVTEKNDEIFVAATTSTNNNGNVTGYRGGVTDIWVFKLSSAGNLLWQRCLGGTKEETFITSGQSILSYKSAVTMDGDGGCLVLGYSTSLNGDVTGYHGTAASNVKDSWLVKLDNAGVLKWQRCFGGTAAEQNGDIIQLNDDNYLLGFSTASTDGDLSGSYGGQDAWLARLGPVSYIKGSVYIDANHNGTRDGGELLYPLNTRLQSVKRQDTTIIATTTGLFTIDRDTGTYVTNAIPDHPFLVPVPASYTSVLANHFTMDSINFGLQPVPGINDLVSAMIPLGVGRPGFPVSFLIVYSNVGTEPLTNTRLAFHKDGKFTYNNASPSQNSIVADTIYWNLGTVLPFEGIKLLQVNCTVKAPPVANNGDTARFTAAFSMNEIDQSPENNRDTVIMQLLGSFDPNDKTENHNGKLLISENRNGEELRYLIRFQNTGTDTAFNVVIKDTLDATRLDLSSFRMIHASHPYRVQSENGRVTWTFTDINLPDSNRNEPKSHGFIAFAIKPKTDLWPDDTIKNAASIYFDFNLPVKTNTNETVIKQDDMVLCPGSSAWLSAYKPGTGYQWQVNDGTGYTPVSDGGYYQGTSTATLQLVSPPGTIYGYKYRCMITTPTGTVYSAEYVVKFRVQWMGTMNNTWENPANWSCGVLPDEFTDVVIPGGMANYPELNTNTSCRSLVLHPSASITVKEGMRLEIRK